MPTASPPKLIVSSISLLVSYVGPYGISVTAFINICSFCEVIIKFKIDGNITHIKKKSKVLP